MRYYNFSLSINQSIKSTLPEGRMFPFRSFLFFSYGVVVVVVVGGSVMCLYRREGGFGDIFYV